jgi:mannose-6-phosphate isomerase-like protein (cupin superfamily)
LFRTRPPESTLAAFASRFAGALSGLASDSAGLALLHPGATRHRIRTVQRIYSILTITGLLGGAFCLLGADRAVDPTFLYRHVPDLAVKQADVSTGSCHYKPIFGEGDVKTRIIQGVARFGEVTIDPGGTCALTNYPLEEQVYFVTSGAPVVLYGAEKHKTKEWDYMYLPPTVKHGLTNPGSEPAKAFIMGWRIPKKMEITIPKTFQIANMYDVDLQVVGNHPPSSKFRLLMGTTESKRDRIAAAHVLTSLFIMEFTPGGTNFPHHHPTEEEFYILLDGTGNMVAGGGMDGVEGKHPAKPGDAYFFRLNCTVGFYSSEEPGTKARILAARSTYPRRWSR